ncbi:MAG: SDR family oxidoreductase [Gammaproteobacteria bacterium]
MKDRSIVITGAGSGLGRAVALRYAREGWRVGVLDVATDRARHVAGEVRATGAEAMSVTCDVSDESAVKRAARRVEKTWGSPDVLVANAGVAGSGTLEDTPMDTWRWIFDVNVFGVVATCRAFLPMMTAAGSGHIVTVSSAAGFVAAPGMAAYNASKAAVISISESLRGEVSGRGVSVSVVCPSFFQTRLLEDFRGTEASREIAAKLMKRSGLQADDVAESIYRAVRKKEFMVVPHADASRILLVKRFAPDVFAYLVRKRGAKMLEAGGGRR